MEQKISSLFNIHETYKKTTMINPYRFADSNSTIKTNLVSAYGFEETSGTTLNDLHSSNDLTIYGSPTMGSTGKIGNCFTFDGTNDKCYKSSNFPSLLNSTISVWLKVDNALRPQYIWSLSYNLNGGSSLCYIGSDPYRIRIYSLGATAKLNDSGVSLTTNTWQMLTAIRNGSNMKIYLGTTQIYSGDTLADDDPFDRGKFELGWATDRDNSSTYYKGSMDLAYVWNKSITTTELSWLYNSGNGRQYSEF